MIIRTFLNKSKRLHKLIEKYEESKNVEKSILSAKPPIFWKDKEIVKRQIIKWSLKQIKGLIFEINELELKIKKNSANSINFLTDFLIQKSI